MSVTLQELHEFIEAISQHPVDGEIERDSREEETYTEDVHEAYNRWVNRARDIIADWVGVSA